MIYSRFSHSKRADPFVNGSAPVLLIGSVSFNKKLGLASAACAVESVFVHNVDVAAELAEVSIVKNELALLLAGGGAEVYAKRKSVSIFILHMFVL